MKTAPRIICCGIAIFAAAVLGGCGSSGSSAAPATPTDDTTSVSNAVPSDVVLASPTASTTASSNLAVKSLHKALAGDAAGQSYEEKKAAGEALQAGTGDCGFTPSMTIPTPPACYGPSISFANHQDGSNPPGQPDFMPPRDVGFWSLSEVTEACAAAQMNFLINAVSTRVDMMINMFNNMVCVGKKDGLLLPALGATTDFKSSLGTKSTMDGVTVNVAMIERLADDSDGNPVYKSTVNVTIGTSTGTAILKHIKTGDGTYKGKLSMTMSNSESQSMMGGNNCGSSSGSVHAGVVSYVKSSATSMVYEMNFAEFCGATASPFDSNNNISRTDTYDATLRPNGWGNDWNYALFNLNPSNGTGTVAYAWQAGAGDGRTRVLNSTVTEAADTSASGTAYYGFGPGVNGTGTLGTIEGFVCNWAGPNGKVNTQPVVDSDHTSLVAANIEQNKAQKQILSRAVGGTEFTTTATDSNITYAPAKSCNKTAANFTYQAVTSEGPGGGGGTVLEQTNNNIGATLFNNDLVDVSEITTNFTLPTPPTDVGG